MTGNDDSTSFTMKLLEFEEAEDLLIEMLRWMSTRKSRIPIKRSDRLQSKRISIETIFRYCNEYPKVVTLVASGKIDAKN